MLAAFSDMNWQLIATATLTAVFGVDAMYFAIAAIGLNVQFGYAGLLNFGQAGFMACGAYAIGMTAHYWNISFWWGIPMAIGYATVFGLIMGIPTLRLRSDYLAIVTIALAELLRLIVRSVTFKKYFNGSDGINGFGKTFTEETPFNPSGKYSLWPFDQNANLFGRVMLLLIFSVASVMVGRMIADRLRGPREKLRVILPVVIFALVMLGAKQTEYGGLGFKSLIVGWLVVFVIGALIYMLMRSPWGRVIKGIREDEEAVRSLGKNIYSYKLQALILGGAIATFGGMMFSLSRGSVQPDNYSRDTTFFVLTALVLGGLAKVTGSIVGPMLYWGISQFISVFLFELTQAWGGRVEIFGVPLITSSSQIGAWVQGLLGLMLVLLMVFRPQGLFGNRKEMALDGR
ncbi:MAG: branched-chain amino acid ABC transporter permease [Actinobacteria bacterium]|nr:branched-chain amino acid ABC transporter permease [Actinomycetota bacterium]